MVELITFKEVVEDNKIFLYPDCVKAELFAELLSIKQFNIWHLEIIEKLGFEYKIKPISVN